MDLEKKISFAPAMNSGELHVHDVGKPFFESGVEFSSFESLLRAR